jgi:hypothetical protein
MCQTVVIPVSFQNQCCFRTTYKQIIDISQLIIIEIVSPHATYKRDMPSGAVFIEAPKVRLILRLRCTARKSKLLGAQQDVSVAQTACVTQ